jgi:hypothetical protein
MNRYLGSSRERALKLAIKKDVLEILKIGAKALYWVKDREGLQRQLQEIKDNYDKI